MKTRKLLTYAFVIFALLCSSFAVQGERIKDLTRVAGVRNNQLIGYGLVVGLDGTGDQTGQTPFTVQSMKSMLNRFGVRVPPNVNPQLKNVAAVTLHGNLPPFAKPGQTIDITVSTIGNAKSLRGGSLLMTPMQGADGQIYAIAQGNLVVGGFGAATEDGNSITVNIPTVGRIPNGAMVERPAPTVLGGADSITLNLNQSDFTTAKRVADAVNKAVGEGAARALDNTSVQVSAPRDSSQRVAFLSIIENISLEPAEAAAKVIVNSRTGTIVIGRHVRVSMAAVAHGKLSVSITNATEVSQPAPLSGGATTVVPASNIRVQEEDVRAFLFKPGISLNEIVRAINQVGAAPSDLVAILEALKQAGALRAELIVI
ncbi:MAG: flagellar basal body P-ring protein FlgI [Gammaproteobacteria bacterium]|nr:flagellar basal body P-ring protein FlgI [Gammaproteobacteria bacterium]